MFDRERKVEVTPRPCRGRGDDSLCQLGIGESVITLEFEAHDFEVAALTFDILTGGGPGTQDRGKRGQ
jgi:hypothetical protein